MPEALKNVQATTLYLDADLHQAVKIAAIEDHTQMTTMVEQAIKEFLERRKKTRTK